MAPRRPAPPIDRRRFLTDAARAAAGCAVAGSLLALYARDARALPAEALRPPGALDEPDFLAACIRCGLCVRDCPYDTLSLADLGEGAATGTPFFTARQIPCEMCDDIPCVKACPTEAIRYVPWMDRSKEPTRGVPHGYMPQNNNDQCGICHG